MSLSPGTTTKTTNPQPRFPPNSSPPISAANTTQLRPSVLFFTPSTLLQSITLTPPKPADHHLDSPNTPSSSSTSITAFIPADSNTSLTFLFKSQPLFHPQRHHFHLCKHPPSLRPIHCLPNPPLPPFELHPPHQRPLRQSPSPFSSPLTPPDTIRCSSFNITSPAIAFPPSFLHT